MLLEVRSVPVNDFWGLYGPMLWVLFDNDLMVINARDLLKFD